jgi:hypothetical protein
MKPLVRATLLVPLLALGCGTSEHPSSHETLTGPFPKDHFLPGGIRTLAAGHVPHGPAFAISVLRYRFQGKLHSDLQAQMQPHARLSGASGSFSPSSGEPFDWTTEQGCSRAATWSIVYGLLRDPHDRGVLYIGAERRPLRRLRSPPVFISRACSPTPRSRATRHGCSSATAAGGSFSGTISGTSLEAAALRGKAAA